MVTLMEGAGFGAAEARGGVVGRLQKWEW